MIPVCTCKEMHNIDEAAIAGDPKVGFHYMQHAARGLFDLVINKYLELQKQNQEAYIITFCGHGNNGGDGILLSAYLAEEGYPVHCFIVGSTNKLQNEAKQAYLELEKYNSKNQYITFINDPLDLNLVQAHITAATQKNKHILFVDALLGIGAKGDPREPHASIIKLINDNRNLGTVYAVDCPSGIDNDSGQIHNISTQADTTLTMGYPKLGSFFYPGRANYGLTIVNNLGYPQDVFEKEYKSNTYFVNAAKELLPPRITNGTKFDHGVATLVAGSPGMTGAATLASLAAYRSGLGLLHAISDPESCKIISSNILEVVSHQLSNDLEQDLSLTQSLQEKRSSVTCIGPGLSLKRQDFVLKLLEHLDTPIILDADGINSFRDHINLLKDHKTDLLITPHSGEYNRLFPDDLKPDIQANEFVNLLQARAMEFQMTILYKGSPTIIADPSGKCFIVPYGNSGLATAGSGDVLSGLITGIAAQIYSIKQRHPNLQFAYQSYDLSPLSQAAILGAYIHGKAGENASENFTEYSVTASDIVEYIPNVIKQL